MSKRNYVESFSQDTDYSGSSKRQTTYPVRMPSVHKVTFTKSVKKAVPKAKYSGETFAAKVKRVMLRAAEKKQVDETLSQTYFGSAATNSQLAIAMLPNASTLSISQGTAVNNRVGNRVRIKKVTFRGSIVPAVYDAAFNQIPQPQHVKMYFLSYKGDPNGTVAPLTPPFYRSGATTSAMNGALTDPYKQLDHESLVVYKEVLFKIGPAANGGTGAIATSQFYTNNDFKECQEFSFDVTKWCPKEIVFDDTTLAPTSRQLTCVVESTNAISGTAMGTTSSLVVGITYQIHIEYTDV